jgi:predicted Rossmann fold flavoprotein
MEKSASITKASPRSSRHAYDVIVIGGGASGMIAAGRAAENGRRVLLIEKNKKLGAKLAISGGGRCNILNAEEDEKKLLSNYGKAEKFLYSTFALFGMKDTYDFFESKGLKLKVEANNRAFPETENAEDVVRILRDYMKKGNVEVHQNKSIDHIVVKGGCIQEVFAGKEKFSADSYILATGGVSHPETGSTGDGFNWLEEFGHTVQKPTPTIVPLAAKDKWIKELSGTTLEKARITFYLSTDTLENKKQFSRTGNILLTHFGLSGPTILNCAGKVGDLLYEGSVTARIDVCADLDIGSLDAKIVEIFNANKNKLLRNVAKEFMPAGTTDVLLSLLAIDPETKVHSVLKEDRRKIVDLLKALPVTISGLMGFDRAVVADGGVSLTEVDMKTMQSKRIQNLFITGDLLNISRPSGGYSLQLCWATGFLAGENA